MNLFISSILEYEGIKIEQKSLLPNAGKTTLTFLSDYKGNTVKIRRPEWAQSVRLFVNDEQCKIKVAPDGYIAVSNDFAKGDIVDVYFDMAMTVDSMPDMPFRSSFRYGPTLLACQLQQGQEMPLIVAGDRDELLDSFVKTGECEFELPGFAKLPSPDSFDPVTLSFIPLYSVADQSYSVYLDIIDQDKWQEKQKILAQEIRRRAQLEAATTDYIAVGQMQAERDHNLTNEGDSGVGSFGGKNWRDTDGGWFAFDMQVDPDSEHQLICTYWGSDRGNRKFDLLVDDVVIGTQQLNNNKPDSFFDVSYDIPVSLTNGKNKVVVKLKAHSGSTGGGLFGARVIKKQD